jgi:hypothetical protein
MLLLTPFLSLLSPPPPPPLFLPSLKEAICLPIAAADSFLSSSTCVSSSFPSVSQERGSPPHRRSSSRHDYPCCGGRPRFICGVVLWCLPFSLDKLSTRPPLPPPMLTQCHSDQATTPGSYARVPLFFLAPLFSPSHIVPLDQSGLSPIEE